ncbi:MAG: glycosyltransferase family 4 protein [Patescibacteria group bacterium]
MRILHTVEQYSPSVGGMQEVVKQLSEKLVDLGHDVTIATSYHSNRNFNNLNGVKIKSFKISGNVVLGYESETNEIKRYQDFLCNSNFDIITNFAAQQWATDLMLEILDKIKTKKIFIPTGFSGLYHPRYKEYFKKIDKWMKQYDLNIFLSNNYRDINFAREQKVKKIIVIPNGASADEFLNTEFIDIRVELNIPKNNFLILNVGSHTGTKGHKEAVSIFSKANIKNSTLLIIGNYFNKSNNFHPTFKNKIKTIIKKLIYPTIGCLNFCQTASTHFNNLSNNKKIGKKLIIVSKSRLETINAYKQADLFLFPSNIECSPLVLFEAMASKIPFLTTDVGNSKEIIKWSNGGMLLPTIKDKKNYSHAQINESADLLNKLYNNKALRERLAQNGFNAWQKKFTWEKITKNYEEQYKKLIKNL